MCIWVNWNFEDEDKDTASVEKWWIQTWREREKKKGFNGVSWWPARKEEEEKFVHTYGEV